MAAVDWGIGDCTLGAPCDVKRPGTFSKEVAWGCSFGAARSECPSAGDMLARVTAGCSVSRA
eukprot:2287658-Alexandrium_andersonii.AAC.1